MLFHDDYKAGVKYKYTPYPGLSMSDDIVALTSDIGTWTAAFFAIVALTGIIGPWLAIRAASSDKNRAFNAIYDKDKVYVKFRGIPIGSRLRVFRRIRVPDLAPNYKSNESETLSLLPSADQSSKVDTRYITSTDERIIFRPQSYSRFNKGWSKLCTTLDSYEVDAARFQLPQVYPHHAHDQIQDRLPLPYRFPSRLHG